MKRMLSLLSAAVMAAALCFFGVSAFADDGRIDISAAQVAPKYTSVVYSGSAYEPAVTVTLNYTDPATGAVNNTVLNAQTDYSVSYSDNINAGMAKITVKGKGSYKGTASSSFEITKKSLKDKDIKVTVDSRTLVGSAPAVTMKYGSLVLENSKDYTTAVTGNDKVGYKKGKVTVSGTGNFKDSKTAKFNVYPTAVTSVKTSNIKQNSLTLSWESKQNEGISGYKIYKSSNESGTNAKLIKTVSSKTATKTTISNLDSSTRYYIFVAAYATNNKKTVIGDFSSACTVSTKPSKVTVNSVYAKGKNKINVSWKKVYNASGYEIKFSNDKKLKNDVKKIKVKGSKTSKTISVSNNKKAYYFKVRAYKTYSKNGKTKTSYGPWSVKVSSLYGKVYKSYTTKYPYNPNRTTNLKLACKAINGTIVNPGETFSFNDTVGIRTAEKGYKPATVFLGPNDDAKEVGGGVCQVASTMFNAALLSNFTIVERHQHSQKITYCPLGRDAAIYWKAVDFKFKNNTDYPIKIVMSCKDGKVTCKYMVSGGKSAPKVKLSVSHSGNNYTLKRTVKGKVNYTAKSTY